MRLYGAAEAMRDHGVHVVEVAEVVGGQIIEGDTWKRRGHEYSKAPVCITWHHDAHGGAWPSIVGYELHKYESTPGNNVNINRDGRVALLASGATATNGAGVEMQFSRGMGGRNSSTFTMEIHNSGNGSQPYPEVQIDACFNVSNAINELCGNQPTDLCTHHQYAPTRKTDPATAGAVQGRWRPRSTTSAGTWDDDDIRTEAVLRWGAQPPPGEADMGMMSVCSWEPGRLDLFVTGEDKRLWHRAYWTEWYPWEDLGGQLIGAPTAVSWEKDRIDVFGTGLDGQVWQIGWQGAAGWSGWHAHGDQP